jgi:hypothetical protein
VYTRREAEERMSEEEGNKFRIESPECRLVFLQRNKREWK